MYIVQEKKLNPDKALAKLEQLNKKIKKENRIRVGLPKNSNAYPDGTSVIMVGSVHEFGSPSRNIPSRSYLRSTLNENRNNYKTLSKKTMLQIFLGKIKFDTGFAKLATIIVNDIKMKITEIKTPILKHRKGNPLIDTGHLRQSITYRIGGKDGD